MKIKILAFIVGAELALIGLVTHYLLHRYEKLWITIPVIAILACLNFMIASYGYYFQNTNTITTGDLYINEHGGINFNLPIILITNTLLYYAYFTGEDASSFTLTLTLTHCIFIYYSWPIAQLDENGNVVE